MAYVLSRTQSCARRAHGAREAGYFFMDQFRLTRRFQRGIARPWAGSGSLFGSAGRDPGTDPDRENGHYENIYIDNIVHVDNMQNKKFATGRIFIIPGLPWPVYVVQRNLPRWSLAIAAAAFFLQKNKYIY